MSMYPQIYPDQILPILDNITSTLNSLVLHNQPFYRKTKFSNVTESGPEISTQKVFSFAKVAIREKGDTPVKTKSSMTQTPQLITPQMQVAPIKVHSIEHAIEHRLTTSRTLSKHIISDSPKLVNSNTHVLEIGPSYNTVRQQTLTTAKTLSKHIVSDSPKLVTFHTSVLEVAPSYQKEELVSPKSETVENYSAVPSPLVIIEGDGGNRLMEKADESLETNTDIIAEHGSPLEPDDKTRTSQIPKGKKNKCKKQERIECCLCTKTFSEIQKEKREKPNKFPIHCNTKLWKKFFSTTLPERERANVKDKLMGSFLVYLANRNYFKYRLKKRRSGFDVRYHMEWSFPLNKKLHVIATYKQFVTDILKGSIMGWPGVLRRKIPDRSSIENATMNVCKPCVLSLLAFAISLENDSLTDTQNIISTSIEGPTKPTELYSKTKKFFEAWLPFTGDFIQFDSLYNQKWFDEKQKKWLDGGFLENVILPLCAWVGRWPTCYQNEYVWHLHELSALEFDRWQIRPIHFQTTNAYKYALTILENCDQQQCTVTDAQLKEFLKNSLLQHDHGGNIIRNQIEAAD